MTASAGLTVAYDTVAGQVVPVSAMNRENPEDPEARNVPILHGPMDSDSSLRTVSYTLDDGTLILASYVLHRRGHTLRIMDPEGAVTEFGYYGDDLVWHTAPRLAGIRWPCGVTSMTGQTG